MMRKNPNYFLSAILITLTIAAAIVSISFISCNPPESKEPVAAAAAAKPSVPLIPEDKVRLSNDPQKTELFRDAGLGLFIHWGPNSQVGTEISWPLYNASDDFIKKYYALAETFNPTHFDPAEWASLAKLAGMAYVVFTTKHHDGFCMFDTAYSNFKITKTPYGRDITAQIAEAFRREGILVGFYYSPGDFRYQYETGLRTGHIYEPDFAAAAPFGPLQKNFLEYEQGQIEELLTRYGDIFLLWFDGKCEPLKKHAWRVKQDVFISRGEIPTPEQTIPGQPMDYAWESCMTTSWQWSYQPNPDVRTIKEVLANLIRIRARGGNMLLNVGPRPDGRISPPDENLLRELGLWMMLNGEAIRGVRPWHITNEGDIWFTCRRSDNTVYAFVNLEYGLDGIKAPAGARFTLKSVKTTPETKISVLSQEGGCEWKEDESGLHITVSRLQTIQFIKTPPLKPGSKRAAEFGAFTWGPDWPIVVKITKAKPAAKG